jgi:hypothetical protein
MRLPTLVICVVLGSITLPSLAQTPVQVTPASDIVGTIGNAQPGTEIDFTPGTYNITTPINVPTGVKITSSEGKPDDTFLVFQLAGADQSSYGFVLAGGAKDVTITELDIVSNHGIVQMSNGSTYTNIQIVRNNLAYGSGQLSDGTLVFGISGTVTNNALQISHNYFHDSQNTIRNWSVWYASGSNFDYNVFYNVNDGGQIDNPGANVTFSHNYGTLLHRMGQEMALQSNTTLTADGNVFYDYVLPYNDTEGMSIIGVSSVVDITNNYLKASIAAGSTWGQADGGGNHRFGYAIEGTGSAGSSVSKNTIVGPWADFVSSDISNLSVTNNSTYGSSLWGNFEGEPGPYGYGSVVTSGNTSDTNVNDAPPPPANNAAFGAGVNGNGVSVGAGSNPGGTTAGGSAGSDTGTGAISSQVVVPPSITDVQVIKDPQSPSGYTLTWHNPSVNISYVTIQIISAVGRESYATVTLTGAQAQYQLPNDMPLGWYLDFVVTAHGSGTTTPLPAYTSPAVTALFPGNPSATWQALLWGGVSTAQATPYQ